MSINTVAHLNFRGNATQALTFYEAVFGGHRVTMTYKDADAVQDPAEADQVMWGQVTAPSGFAIMAYDVPSRMPYDQGENAFFISLSSESADEIRGLWEKLSDGAAIVQPLAPAGFSPLYGMLKDRFGVIWVVAVTPPQTGG